MPEVNRHVGHDHGHAVEMQDRMVHPPGQHVHVHEDHAHVHDPLRDGLVFYAVMFGLVFMQFALKYWKQRNPRSFQGVSLLLLWAFPGLSSLMSHAWKFFATWLLFTLSVVYHMRLARAKPLKSTTPKRVYRFFDTLYKAASGTAIGSYTALMSFILMPPLQLVVPQFVISGLVAGCMCGIYFCVVGRDVTEYCAETIANSLGYTKKHDDDDVVKAVPRGLCALCGEDLKSAGEIEEGGADGDMGALDPHAAPFNRGFAQPAGSRPAANRRGGAQQAPSEEQRTVRLRGAHGETLYRLACKHEFHANCIKGWCVVGKKGMCPCCLERVDLRSIVGSTLWAQPSVLWTQLLDAVRYFVVWLPLLLLGIRVLLSAAGVSMSDIIPIPGANATSAGAAGLASLPQGAPIAAAPGDVPALLQEMAAAATPLAVASLAAAAAALTGDQGAGAAAPPPPPPELLAHEDALPPVEAAAVDGAPAGDIAPAGAAPAAAAAAAAVPAPHDQSQE